MPRHLSAVGKYCLQQYNLCPHDPRTASVPAGNEEISISRPRSRASQLRA